MITVVEWRNENYEFELHTSFCVLSKELAKSHFSDALESSSYECQYPYISIIIYSDDGKSNIGMDDFKSIDDALEWWLNITNL